MLPGSTKWNGNGGERGKGEGGRKRGGGKHTYIHPHARRTSDCIAIADNDVVDDRCWMMDGG